MAVSVLGAGSWGTALAIALGRRGQPVRLWGRDPAAMARIAQARVNQRYLPGAELPETVSVTSDLAAASTETALLVVAVPSHGFDSTLRALAPMAPGAGLAWATKGFDPATGELLHHTARARLGDAVDLAVISGPTFAREVAAGLPTAVTIASENAAFADLVASRLHDARLRAYTSSDVIGVEVGGAVKNVLAIAAGIADGLGFGANTRAALITRGLAELVRLGVALGGHPETFMGLAGLGDLVLTCTDDQSRNRRFGLALASGLDVAAAQASVGQVVEGIASTRQTRGAGRACQVEMPIVEQVHRVIEGEVTPEGAVRVLLERPARSEQPGS